MTSCKKKETETPDTDTQAAQDNNMAEQNANDAVNMTGQASENGSVSYKQGIDGSILSGATFKRDTTAKVDSIIFNGLCLDGKTRTGLITLTYGANQNNVHYRHVGFTCHVRTFGYTVNDGTGVHTVSVDHTTTNTGFNSSNNLTWAVTSTVTVVKPNSGGTVNWNCNRTHELLNTSAAYSIGGVSVAACYNGTALPITWNTAVIATSGSANGVSAKNESYTLSVTSPLIVNMGCAPNALKPAYHPFVKGSFDFTPGSKGKRSVDFGTGGCDVTATVTITGTNGHTYGPYTINLW